MLRTAGREATVRLHFGGFLGVSGTYDDDRCRLTNVVADSAAAEAGLQVGDVIVKLDGQAIDNFQELADAVALTPPEQPIPLEIERDGTPMKLTVSLRRAEPPPRILLPP